MIWCSTATIENKPSKYKLIILYSFCCRQLIHNSIFINDLEKLKYCLASVAILQHILTKMPPAVSCCCLYYVCI